MAPQELAQERVVKMAMKTEPVKCKDCNVYPNVMYGISGGWEHLRCPKCGQKSKSYQNKAGYEKAVNLWNKLNGIDQ